MRFAIDVQKAIPVSTREDFEQEAPNQGSVTVRFSAKKPPKTSCAYDHMIGPRPRRARGEDNDGNPIPLDQLFC